MVGHAAWRSASYEDWRKVVHRLLACGAFPEPTYLWWDVRAPAEVRQPSRSGSWTSRATRRRPPRSPCSCRRSPHLELEEGYHQTGSAGEIEILSREHAFIAARDGMGRPAAGPRQRDLHVRPHPARPPARGRGPITRRSSAAPAELEGRAGARRPRHRSTDHQRRAAKGSNDVLGDPRRPRRPVLTALVRPPRTARSSPCEPRTTGRTTSRADPRTRSPARPRLARRLRRARR